MKKTGNFYYHGDREKNEIALTFDDGPSEETLQVLKILKKFNAKATFFIWGQRIKGRERIIRKIIKEGHEIGNHTFSHKRLYFKSKDFIERDIKKCDEELAKFKIKTKLVRCPGFKFGVNSILTFRKLKKRVIFCDVISKDWLNHYLKSRLKRKGKVKINEVVKKVLIKTKKGSIINFHDYIEGVGRHKEITEILEKIFPKLKTRGFKFVTVSKLLGFSSS